MQAIILAGGKGTRLAPLTKELPKPMVKVLNRPLMEYNIELLKKHGFTDIGVTLLYLPQYIKQYFGNGDMLGVRLSYYEEDMPLGTAGCLTLAQNELDENFVVISGDSLTDIDLSKAFAYHTAKKADVTIVLSKQEHPLEYGVVMTDSESKITSFIERPLWENVTANTVNTGIYIINRKILDDIPKNKEYDFSRDLFPKLLSEGKSLFGYVSEDYWCDLGTPETYLQGHRDILSGKVFGNKYGNTVEEGVSVAEGVKLNAPVFIGRNAVIAGNSVVGPYAVVGEGAVINNSDVINSVIWERATVEGCQAHDLIACNNSVLSGCVLGGFNCVGAYATVNKNAHLKRKASVDSYATVPREAVVDSCYSGGERDKKEIFQNGQIVGLWNNTITPAMLLGLASSIKCEKILICYTLNSEPIARLLASFFVLCGTTVYFSNANESAGRFHSSVYEIDGISVKYSSFGLSIDIWDKKGLNISHTDEKKISFTADSLSTKHGKLVRLTGLENDFEYFVNSAFPFVSSNIAVSGGDEYKLHNIVYRGECSGAIGAIKSVNGGISELTLKGKKVQALDFMRLKVNIASFLGAKSVYLPPYATDEILAEAEKKKLKVLFTEQHKGNSMQKAKSFNSTEILLEYEPSFFALALLYYTEFNELEANRNGDTVLTRYEFDCPRDKMCNTIFALNRNRDGKRITANYKNGFITVLPKNDGFSFTAYGRFAKEEYAPDIMPEFVNTALSDI